MVIEIRNKGKCLTFEDWTCADPNFMWFRALSINAEVITAAGVVLLKFGELWSVKFFGSALSGVVTKSYDLMYPDGKEYPSIEEAREEIDRFLHRVSLLKVFL